MNDLSIANDFIHDSNISSYNVNLLDQTLIINMKSYEGDIQIEFRELLAHKFINVIKDNILFDIEEQSIDEFIGYKERNLKEEISYGFPTVEVDSIDELQAFLKENNYKVFSITASLGLNGYIIAKEFKFSKETK